MLVNFNVVVASLLSEARRHSSIHAKGCVSEGYTPPPLRGYARRCFNANLGTTAF